MYKFIYRIDIAPTLNIYIYIYIYIYRNYIVSSNTDNVILSVPVKQNGCELIVINR